MTGPNFLDWFINLKIILRVENVAYVLNRPLPQSPPIDASDSDKSAFQKHVIDSEMSSCIMLTSMTTKLQKQHKTMGGYTIVFHLRELFDKHARSKRFEVSKLLFSTKMQVGTSRGAACTEDEHLYGEIGSTRFHNGP